MTNSEILAQAEAIVNLGNLGETGKRHDAIEGMRLMIEKDGVSSFLCSGGLADNEAEIRRLKYAIERLGSMEAFAISRVVNKEGDAELMARIDYARQVLAG